MSRKTNCKPGDIAITTYAHIPENQGRIVEVVRFYCNDEYGVRWWVRPVGSAMLTGDGERKEGGHFPDMYLRPVSGLPDVEDVETKEPVKEIA